MQRKAQIVILEKGSPIPSVLLLKTNRQRGGFWQNVTGSVEDHESFLEGAKRELWEETGIQMHSLQELNLSFEFMDRWGREVEEKVYLGLLDKAPAKIKLQAEEHDEYKWLTVDNVSEGQFGHKSNYRALVFALKVLE